MAAGRGGALHDILIKLASRDLAAWVGPQARARGGDPRVILSAARDEPDGRGAACWGPGQTVQGLAWPGLASRCALYRTATGGQPWASHGQAGLASRPSPPRGRTPGLMNDAKPRAERVTFKPLMGLMHPAFARAAAPPRHATLRRGVASRRAASQREKINSNAPADPHGRLTQSLLARHPRPSETSQPRPQGAKPGAPGTQGRQRSGTVHVEGVDGFF